MMRTSKIYFAGESQRRVLAHSSSINPICLVIRCAAPCGARATRWGAARRCGSAEQQACPPQMLRIAVSGLPSRKSKF
jgi:hypothetical protein